MKIFKYRSSENKSVNSHCLHRSQVNWAFDKILERDVSNLPDDDVGILAHQSLPSLENLIETLLNSEEYKSKLLNCKPEKKSSNYYFVVIGNCQALRISEILNVCQPKHASIGIEIFEKNVEKIYSGEFNSLFETARHILFLGLPDDKIAIHLAGIVEKAKISYLPPISFMGFQPDNGYVVDKANNPISGPLGHYQSILTFWSWKNGFTRFETEFLFCEDVFSHLGYFDIYNQSVKELISLLSHYPYHFENAVQNWRSRGCFMHSVNHPKLFVLADIVKIFLFSKGYRTPHDVDVYIKDQFTEHGCWPVYPELGKKLSIPGSYDFKKIGANPVFISKSELIDQSFDTFSRYSAEELECHYIKTTAFDQLMSLARLIISKSDKHVVRGVEFITNPYKRHPDYCFWKRGVASVSRGEVDPVVAPPFGMGTEDLVATAGSCFAQHIAKRLSGKGFNYYVPEDGGSIPEEERTERNFGIFSCRYGNVYTTRQLVQLFDRSMGRFSPNERAWKRPDGRYVDPFRPQIEPAGFESEEAMLQSRNEHLERVKEMFTKLDILVFTLGLTESWESMEDGAVFPLAPGVAGGVMDPARHRFHNMTAKEVADDLELFLLKLEGVNSRARVILTVSPVPLIATYEKRHVLVSNTHSKSVLRTVAGEMASRYPQCDYFPSYEIITGQHAGNDYLEEDLRSVRSEGVDHVMRVFLKHYAGKQDPAQIDHKAIEREAEQKAAIERINAVICDEEAIDAR